MYTCVVPIYHPTPSLYTNTDTFTICVQIEQHASSTNKCKAAHVHKQSCTITHDSQQHTCTCNV